MTAQPHGARRARALFVDHWPAFALAAVAVGVAIWSHHALYPAFSWNRDEPVYLWQIDALRAGEILPTDGGWPEHFRPWLTGLRDGAMFSQYTLGWPLALLASDLLVGTPEGALALGAALAVVGTYALAFEITRDRALATVSGAVLLLSPIVAVQAGIYLGYLFTLGLGLVFAATLVSGVRLRSRVRLVIAGAVLGWIFLTRPYDALLWGAAVVGYLAITERHQARELLRQVPWFAIGIVPLVVATLAYNARVTGSATTFPITAADPLDTFGFGERRLMPGFDPVEYDLSAAVRGSGKNSLYLPIFLAGSYLGLLVAAAGLWLRRRDRTTWLLLAIGAVFPLGYFFFWGMHISGLTARISGPIYYIPAYAPLSILIATVLLHLWRERRGTCVAIAVVLAVVTVPFAVDRLQLNHDISEAQRPWHESDAAIDGRALVFVSQSGPYLLHLNPYSRNGPDVDDDVLYAADRGARNLDLIESMPDRTAYMQRASAPPEDLRPREDPITPTIELIPVTIERGEVVTLRLAITNVSGAPAVAASLQASGSTTWKPLAESSRRGESYTEEWRFAPTAAPGVRALPAAAGIIEVGAGFGDTLAEAQRRPDVRIRVAYRTVGSQVEVLLPTTSFRLLSPGGRTQWFPVPTPELDLTVQAGPD